MSRDYEAEEEFRLEELDRLRHRLQGELEDKIKLIEENKK